MNPENVQSYTYNLRDCKTLAHLYSRYGACMWCANSEERETTKQYHQARADKWKMIIDGYRAIAFGKPTTGLPDIIQDVIRAEIVKVFPREYAKEMVYFFGNSHPTDQEIDAMLLLLKGVNHDNKK